MFLFSMTASHKFTTCMTIVPLNLLWTSPHGKDVPRTVDYYIRFPGEINFFQPGSQWGLGTGHTEYAIPNSIDQVAIVIFKYICPTQPIWHIVK